MHDKLAVAFTLRDSSSTVLVLEVPQDLQTTKSVIVYYT